MKVLMLSTDESIFKDGSLSQERMKDYGTLVEELHVIIKTQNPKHKIRNFGNVYVYPTNDWIKPLFFFNAYRIGKSIIRNLKLEIRNYVITCQDPFETGLVGYLLKKKFKISLQIQVHTDFLSPYFWRESVKNKIRVILGKWLVKKADGLRVVSERIKRSLGSKLYVSSSKIIVLPIFIDVQQIKESQTNTDLHQKYPGQFIILMASRLTKEKNIPMALEAIRRLTRNNTQINAEKVLLLIVGSGPESENLKLQVTSYKLQDSVIFEPWTNDLPSYYKTADLFLLTSNYEGYGRTVVEATAAGLPVVMTDVGVAVGSVVPVDDKKALVEKLDLLIKSQLEREKSLEDQRKVLDFYASKEDYLSKIKNSWESCFL